MKKIIVLIVLFLVSCAPSTQQLQEAYYGPFPMEFKSIVCDYLDTVLIDPGSLDIAFHKAPYRGYFRTFGTVRYGYIVEATINAKNRMGGYVGKKRYMFLIFDGSVVESQQKI